MSPEVKALLAEQIQILTEVAHSINRVVGLSIKVQKALESPDQTDRILEAVRAALNGGAEPQKQTRTKREEGLKHYLKTNLPQWLANSPAPLTANEIIHLLRTNKFKVRGKIPKNQVYARLRELSAEGLLMAKPNDDGLAAWTVKRSAAAASA